MTGGGVYRPQPPGGSNAVSAHRLSEPPRCPLPAAGGDGKFAVRRLPLAVLLADIDHFKGINDTFGHPAGDEVLRGIADLAREVLRRSDVICRWGGEEFLILLRGTDLREATRIAERLREKVAETIFPPLPSNRAVTVSVGGCSLPPFLAPEQLISQADTLLYRAKREGRNRVILC